jgi:hypothetical protein
MHGIKRKLNTLNGNKNIQIHKLHPTKPLGLPQ